MACCCQSGLCQCLNTSIVRPTSATLTISTGINNTTFFQNYPCIRDGLLELLNTALSLSFLDDTLLSNNNRSVRFSISGGNNQGSPYFGFYTISNTSGLQCSQTNPSVLVYTFKQWLFSQCVGQPFGNSTSPPFPFGFDELVSVSLTFTRTDQVGTLSTFCPSGARTASISGTTVVGLTPGFYNPTGGSIGSGTFSLVFS